MKQVPFDRQDYVPNQRLEKFTDNATDYSWHRYLFKKGWAGIKMLQMIRACNGVYENLKHGVLEAGSQKQTDRKYLSKARFIQYIEYYYDDITCRGDGIPNLIKL